MRAGSSSANLQERSVLYGRFRRRGHRHLCL